MSIPCSTLTDDNNNEFNNGDRLVKSLYALHPDTIPVLATNRVYNKRRPTKMTSCDAVKEIIQRHDIEAS